MSLKHYLFIALCGIVCSCSAPKDVAYFQGADTLTPEQLSKMGDQTYSNRITNDDLLSITVTAWDPAAVTPFNPPVYAYAQPGDQAVYSSPSMYTYLVDKNGDIKFPVLGEIHIAGLTKSEVSAKLEKMISNYVDNPLVNVQLLNFKVTLMGDFTRPGTYTVKNDRVSILDAIGLAGDLQISANRKNIMVIRENDGKKEIHRLDITQPDIFASPCYYLRQNDVVYVEPIASKQRARNSRNISVISTVLSSVSVIASMIFSIITLSRSK